MYQSRCDFVSEVDGIACFKIFGVLEFPILSLSLLTITFAHNLGVAWYDFSLFIYLNK